MKTPTRFYDELQNQLPKLIGSPKQINYAKNIRAKQFHELWQDGFHGTDESFVTDCAKLPSEAVWWINSSKAVYPEVVLHIKILQLLGLEYVTPAGADY